MEEEVKCNVMLDVSLFKDNDCFGLELKAKTAKYDDVPSSMKGKACGLRKLGVNLVIH